MKARLILILFGLSLAVFTAEVSARIWTYYIEGHGKSVSERLSVSTNQVTQLSAGSSNLRGLIRTSNIPDVVYELKPLTSGVFQGKPYQSNSFGARDREYSLKKPDNTIRIAGIGDSVMFGWGVNEDENYLSLIENKYEEYAVASNHIEVINFATPGYNTAMEVALLENRVLLYNPDLIVLHVVNNDLEVPLFMSKPHNILSIKESFLLKLISPPSAAGSALVLAGTNSSTEILEEYRHLAGRAAFKAALNKLGIIANQKNIPVVVISGRLPADMLKILSKVSKEQHFILISVKNAIDQILREHNVPNDPKSRAAAVQVSLQDSHPNALGHKAYARTLSTALANIPKIRDSVQSAAFLHFQPILN